MLGSPDLLWFTRHRYVGYLGPFKSEEIKGKHLSWAEVPVPLTEEDKSHVIGSPVLYVDPKDAEY